MGKRKKAQRKELKKWQADAKFSPARDYNFDSISGRSLDLLYYPQNINDEYVEKLGFPGQYPYTRGVHANMYRGKLWTMRQFSGFGTPEESNERYHYLLKQGQTGLSIAYDMPTLMGYDPDHPISLGEVGKCGVNVATLRDMEILLKDIDLGKISISQTINGPAMILLAFYVALAENQGVALDTLRGTLQNDILKEFTAQKEWIFPPEPSMRIITDMLSFCTENMPQYNTISVSGYHIREAGSTAGQELAFTLADGFTYIEYALDAGLQIDDFAPRLSFFFNSHLDFFEEIAKFRAARRIWARHLKEKYGAKTVVFQDDHLMGDKDRVYELLNIVGELKLGSLYQNGLTLYALDRPMLEAFYKAGVRHLVLPVESGSAKVLKEQMKKPLKFHISERVAWDCRELGIYTNTNILIGMPGETKADIEETRKNLKKIKTNWFNIGCASPLVGSEMHDIAQANGYITDTTRGSDYHIAVIKTDDFTPEYIQKMQYILNLELNFVFNSDIELGDYETALTGFKNVTRIRPDHAFAHYFSSVCYKKLGLTNEEETETNTDPNSSDSDGDDTADGEEDNDGDIPIIGLTGSGYWDFREFGGIKTDKSSNTNQSDVNFVVAAAADSPPITTPSTSPAFTYNATGSASVPN